jgi:hypothetical protein
MRDKATPYAYRTGIIEELLRHGVRPTPSTPPERVRDHLNDLYRHQIRRLKAQLLVGTFPEREYSARVAALRRRYPLLTVPLRFWTN